MKYGSELDRVKVLNDVIESSIGGVNEALAQTDAGKIFQVSQYFDDVKESIGEVASEFEIAFIQGIMPTLQPLIDDVLKWIIDHKEDIISVAEDTAKWLTSEDTKQFFEDIGQMVLDIGQILDDIIQIGEDIGLWQGIFDGVKIVVEGIRDIFDAIRDDVEAIRSGGLGNWFKGNYNSYYPGTFESGGMSSGGMMSGSITLNNTFTINNGNSIDKSTVMAWADVLTDRINENLGRMV